MRQFARLGGVFVFCDDRINAGRDAGHIVDRREVNRLRKMLRYREDHGDGRMDFLGRRWLARATDYRGVASASNPTEFTLDKLADRGKLPNRTD